MDNKKKRHLESHTFLGINLELDVFISICSPIGNPYLLEVREEVIKLILNSIEIEIDD